LGKRRCQSDADINYQVRKYETRPNRRVIGGIRHFDILDDFSNKKRLGKGEASLEQTGNDRLADNLLVVQ
jgi:hypothetical protein